MYRSIRSLVHAPAGVIFWLWHIVFIAASLLWFLPNLIIPILNETAAGRYPSYFAVLVVTVFLLPVISIWVLLRLLRGNKTSRRRYFYGFEFPLMLVLSLYLLNLRDYGFPFWWMIVNAALALIFWICFLLKKHKHNRHYVPFRKSSLALIGSTIVAMTGIYLTALILLLLTPIIFYFGVEALNTLSMVEWSSLTLPNFANLFGLLPDLINKENLTGLVLVLLAVLTFLLIAMAPIYIIYMYLGQFFQRVLRTFSARTAPIILATALSTISVFFWLGQQPQTKAFELLAQPAISNQQKQDLISNSQKIRDGLVNAYLGKYRYLSNSNRRTSIESEYQSNLGASKLQSVLAQKTYNILLSPLIYHGDDWNEAITASRKYQHFFDTSIQIAEQKAIVDSMAFYWQEITEDDSELLDSERKFVHLSEQIIDVVQNEKLSTVSITQTMVNKTTREQEIILHFQLPEHAVLTGLWLSNNKANPSQFTSTIAQKTSAHSIVVNETTQGQQSASLDQIGPTQYRLQIAQLQPQPVVSASAKTADSAAPLTMRMDYQTLANKDGTWPMPIVTNARNLYWNEQTATRINGTKVARFSTGRWVSPRAGRNRAGRKNSITPGAVSGLVTPQSVLTAIPMESLPTIEVKANLKNQRLAFVVDGSRSMATQRQWVRETLRSYPQAEIYFCQTSCTNISLHGLSTVVFFGGSQPYDQLMALKKQAAAGELERFSTLIMLTDGGTEPTSMDTNAATKAPLDKIDTNVQLWLLHPVAILPSSYPIDLLDWVTSSGGEILTGSSEDVQERMVWLNMSDEMLSEVTRTKETDIIEFSEHYLWFRHRNEGPSQNSSDIYKPLMISRMLQQKVSATEGDDLALNILQQQAIAAHIVTPYTSMIMKTD